MYVTALDFLNLTVIQGRSANFLYYRTMNNIFFSENIDNEVQRFKESFLARNCTLYETHNIC